MSIKPYIRICKNHLLKFSDVSLKADHSSCNVSHISAIWILRGVKVYTAFKVD